MTRAVEVLVSPSRLRHLTVALVLAVAAAVPGFQAAAGADDPVFVEWASLLPGLTDSYNPDSPNDCVAGRPACLTAVANEMERRYRPLADTCSHNAVFALTYLRTTQTIKWTIEQPGYYADPGWMVHATAVFAKYYVRAYDAWTTDSSSAAVPQAWRIALNAGRNKQVAGSGDMMLGINAHINRDLAFAMAAAGLAGPDGVSEKPSFDTVNHALNSVTVPLLTELNARFDPSVKDNNSPYHLDDAATGNLMFSWREQAWRNAEALDAAPTESARALLAQQIEANSVAQAQAWVASSAYVPPLSSSAGRDTWCAAHHSDAAPLPYLFGTPRG
ncbi:MAG TPA: DUF5995 family protein [Mycobacteriales bacterium]